MLHRIALVFKSVHLPNSKYSMLDFQQTEDFLSQIHLRSRCSLFCGACRATQVTS